MQLRRLLRDTRGLSAVEFALIAPLMVLLYMGLAELTLALMAERRASHSASAVADLVAQSPASISSADLDKLLFIGKAVVAPFQTTGLSLRVSSVRADAAGTPKVAWSKITGPDLSRHTVGTTPTGFPIGLLAATESVIAADVLYKYDTPLKQIIPRTLNFNTSFYLRPRRADAIACPDCPA